MEEWKPAEGDASATAAKPSVFDDVLDGNLVKLEGKSLKKFEQTKRPEKYYVFYYTASWCGPCQQFTPSLVEFVCDLEGKNLGNYRDLAALEKLVK